MFIKTELAYYTKDNLEAVKKLEELWADAKVIDLFRSYHGTKIKMLMMDAGATVSVIYGVGWGGVAVAWSECHLICFDVKTSYN